MAAVDPALLSAYRRELHQHWTERLYAEYHDILHQRRLNLRRPILRLEPLESRWGSWETATRTLTLSSFLIERHGWAATLEVLKHEMAHQLVAEHFRRSELHGPVFQQACSMLGVADWAIRASGRIPEQIPHWKEQVVSSDEERLLKRVEKLLSLATSTNEHEALLAMQRVQEIYARYNLQRLSTRTDTEHVQLTISLGKQRVDRQASMICTILNGHFFVRVILSRLYDPGSLVEFRTVELLGTRQNVLMAEYVYHFLVHQCEALWNAQQVRMETRRRSSRRDFELGVLAGFLAKLEAGKAQMLQAASVEVSSQKPGGGDPGALIRLTDTALASFVEDRFPRLARRGFDTSYRDESAYEAGEREGKRLVLHRGVEGSQGNQGRLLKG